MLFLETDKSVPHSLITCDMQILLYNVNSKYRYQIAAKFPLSNAALVTWADSYKAITFLYLRCLTYGRNQNSKFARLASIRR